MKYFYSIFLIVCYIGVDAQLIVVPSSLSFTWIAGIDNAEAMPQCVNITDASGNLTNWKWDKNFGGLAFAMNLGTWNGQYAVGYTSTPMNCISPTCGADGFGVGTFQDSIVIVDMNNPSNKAVIHFTITVVPKDPSVPTSVSYPDKNLYKGTCFSSTSSMYPQLKYLDSAWCTCPNQYPMGNFAPPAAPGNSYLDPNFGGKVTLLNTKGFISSGFSAHNKYVMVLDTLSGRCNIISAKDGTMIQSYIVLDAGQHAIFGLYWDSCDDETYYVNAGYQKAGFKKVTVGSLSSTVLVDYNKAPYNAPGELMYATNITKDNWIAWADGGQKSLGVYDINNNKTYWTHYSLDEGNLPLSTLISVQLSKGYDKVTGKRYVILSGNPSLMVYSVDTVSGSLNFEFRGPEDTKYGHGTGNMDGVCNPGEPCYSSIGSDTFEDCDGNQYFIGVGGGWCWYQVNISSWLMRKTPQAALAVELGGAHERLFVIHWEGDADKNADVRSSNNSPYFVVSTRIGDANTSHFNSGQTPASIDINSNFGDVMTFGLINGKYGVTRLIKHRSVPYTGGNLPNCQISNDGSLVLENSNFGYHTIADVLTIETGVKPIVNDSLSVTASSKAASCLNNDGVAYVTAVSNQHCGIQTYNYSWSNGSTGLTASKLAAGTYTVTVSNARGCERGTTTVKVTSTNTVGVLALTMTSSDASCSTNNGIASVSAASTGSLSYTWTNGSVTPTASGLAAGVYTVTVNQGGSCSASGTSTVTIGKAASFTTSIMQVNSLCYGGKGSALASVSGASGALSYAWSTNATGATVANLGAGNYTVTVTDVNGCSATSATIISQPPAINASANQLAPALCESASGSATVAASGGSGQLLYSWSTGETGKTGNALKAGNYIVTVIDGNGCTKTTPFSINKIQISGYADGIKNIFCYGDHDGAAIVHVTSGTGPFTYNWSSGASSVTMANSCIADSLAGGYAVVTVTDATGCTLVANKLIEETDSIWAYISSNASACGANSGSASIDQPGGGWWGPWKYTWPDGGTNSSENGLAAGTYVVTLSDNAGCTGRIPINVSSVGGLTPTVNAFATNVSCKSSTNNDGAASVSVSNGSGPYTYSWSNGVSSITSSNSDSITGLVPGKYNYTVTDANGCPVINNLTIKGSTPLTILTSSTSAACGQSDGTAGVIASGGTGNGYQYLWPGGSTAQTVSNLSAGSYAVSVTDAAGCTRSTTVNVITAGMPATMNTPVNVSCYGMSNGAASVVISGGTSPYTFVWSNGASSITTGSTHGISGVSAGAYTVTITDATGCSSQANALVKGPPALTFVSGSINGGCNATNGALYVTTTGGSGSGYTYLWPTGATAATVSGLASGTYSYVVTVTDGSGCVATTTVAANLTGSGMPLTTSVTGLLCYGGKNGTATATAGGGTPPYTYSWSNGINSVTTATTHTADTLITGTYIVTVTDGTGCSGTTTADVSEPSALIIIGGGTQAACGASDGTAYVQAGGGAGSYVYSWSVLGQTGSTATALSAGKYMITVSDANGCNKVDSISVTNSGGPIIDSISTKDVLCKGDATGSATVMATGVGALSYSWSTSTVAKTISTFPAGSYTVSVIDASGCVTSSSLVITEPVFEIAISSVAVTDASCNKNDGSLVATASGGSGGLNYFWTAGTSGATMNNLSPGIYTLTVSDANNCTRTSIASIASKNGVLAHAGVDVSMCRGSSVQLTASGGSSYLWSPAAGLSDSLISNPVAAPANTTMYYVTISAGPCSAVDSVLVTVNAAPVVNAGSDQVVAMGNSVTLSAGGGVSYLWSPASLLDGGNRPIANFLPTSAGTYSFVVLVKDANGCASSDTVTITVSEIKCGEGVFLPNAFSPNNDGQNDILFVRGNCIKALHLSIYNRWGEQVFETDNPENGWDGKFQGKECDSGVFSYYLNAELFSGPPIRKMGNITLVR